MFRNTEYRAAAPQARECRAEQRELLNIAYTHTENFTIKIDENAHFCDKNVHFNRDFFLENLWMHSPRRHVGRGYGAATETSPLLLSDLTTAARLSDIPWSVRAVFVWSLVRPNMLNIPKSASE